MLRENWTLTFSIERVPEIRCGRPPRIIASRGSAQKPPSLGGRSPGHEEVLNRRSSRTTLVFVCRNATSKLFHEVRRCENANLRQPHHPTP